MRKLKSLKSEINWSLISVLLPTLVPFFGTMVLARLLTPNDFGLMAMTSTMVNFLAFFSDFGLSAVTMQDDKLSRREIAGLFWISSGLGLLLGLGCLILIPVALLLFNEPSITPLLATQSINLLLMGVLAQPLAYLKRVLNFKGIAIIEMIASFLSVLGAILMARSGFGVWALALAPVLSSGSRAALFIIHSRLPIFTPEISANLRSHLSFGAYLSVSNFFFYFARHLDDILVGRFFGPVALSFYSRAYQLMKIPNQLPAGAIAHVVVSAISRRKSEGASVWYPTYLNGAVGLSYIISPVLAGLAMTAPEAIELLYGPNWLPAAPLLFWLGLAGVFQPAYVSVGWLIVSMGGKREYFAWSLVSALFLALGFGLATFFDTTAMAFSYFLIGGVLLGIPSQIYGHHVAGVSPRALLLELGKVYTSVALMMAAVHVAGRWGLNDFGLILRLIGKVGVGALVYTGASLILFHPIPIPVFQNLREKFLKKEPVAPAPQSNKENDKAAS